MILNVEIDIIILLEDNEMGIFKNYYTLFKNQEEQMKKPVIHKQKLPKKNSQIFVMGDISTLMMFRLDN